MNRPPRLPSILLVLLCVLPNVARAENARQIVTRMRDNLRVSSEHALVTMSLVDSRGGVRKRQIEWVSQQANGETRLLARVAAPVEMAGTAFLSIRGRNANQRQWLYLPVLKRTRRIAASDGDNRFLGSDFSYADLSPPELDDYDYELTAKTDQQLTIRAVPRANGPARPIEYIVDAQTYLPTRVTFFDHRNQPLKVQTMRQFRRVGPKKWRPHAIEMKTVQTGHRTVLTFDQHQTGMKLPKDLFSERNLKQVGR